MTKKILRTKTTTRKKGTARTLGLVREKTPRKASKPATVEEAARELDVLHIALERWLARQNRRREEVRRGWHFEMCGEGPLRSISRNIRVLSVRLRTARRLQDDVHKAEGGAS